jgi:hypothetical protein
LNYFEILVVLIILTLKKPSQFILIYIFILLLFLSSFSHFAGLLIRFFLFTKALSTLGTTPKHMRIRKPFQIMTVHVVCVPFWHQISRRIAILERLTYQLLLGVQTAPILAQLLSLRRPKTLRALTYWFQVQFRPVANEKLFFDSAAAFLHFTSLLFITEIISYYEIYIARINYIFILITLLLFEKPLFSFKGLCSRYKFLYHKLQ